MVLLFVTINCHWLAIKIQKCFPYRKVIHVGQVPVVEGPRVDAGDVAVALLVPRGFVA